MTKRPSADSSAPLNAVLVHLLPNGDREVSIWCDSMEKRDDLVRLGVRVKDSLDRQPA